jgi:hypothetical protein
VTVAEFETNLQTEHCLGDEIQFIDKSHGSGKITNWHWNFGDNTSNYLQNPFHQYTTVSGSVMVSLKIEDEYGCRDSIKHEILVKGGILNFPNIFTPIERDGKWYFFRPIEDACYFREFQIDVYNKWGIKIWHQYCKEPNCPDYINDSF